MGKLAWKLQLQLSASVRRSIHVRSGDSVTHSHHRRRRTRQRVRPFSTTTTTISHSNKIGDVKASGVGDSSHSAPSPSSSSFSLEPAPVLTVAWPLLQKRFESMKNADGVFPLLTRAQEGRFADVVQERKKEKQKDRPERPDREAAILMILCSVNGQPGVIYTKRADHMALHGGEISFPGGHFDNSGGDSSAGHSATGASPPDQTLLDTALREAHEELLSPIPQLDKKTQQQQPPCCKSNSNLLQPPHLTVLGQTSRIPSLNGTPVTPFLAVLWPNLTVPIARAATVAAAAAASITASNTKDTNADAGATISSSDATTTTNDDDDDSIISVCLKNYFPGDPQEVAAVFFVSLADLLRAETKHTLPINRFGVTEAPCFPVQGHGNLWGLTAYITQPILHRLLRPVFIDTSKMT
jgi:hypothetical protein